MKRVSFLKKAQKGFTLIELIITIVIIGILAAVAIPKFLDLTGDANTGVAQGFAGAMASASAVNYAKSQSGTGGQTEIANCGALTALIEGWPASGWSVDASTGSGVVAMTVTGTAGDCTVTGPGSVKASFKAFGAPAP